jgi:copper(I)-binding protein
MLMLAGSAMAIEADTNIRLDPNPDHISFYNNSTYITCNFTIQETANVTIIFEKYNVADYSCELFHCWMVSGGYVRR